MKQKAKQDHLVPACKGGLAKPPAGNKLEYDARRYFIADEYSGHGIQRAAKQAKHDQDSYFVGLRFGHYR